MRDAVHVQPFRVASEELDTDTIIHASALKEVNNQKKAATEGKDLGKGKERAHPQSVSVGGTGGRPAPQRLAALYTPPS